MTLKAIVTFPDSIKIGTTGGRRLALNITQPATIKTAIVRLGKDGLSAYEIAKKYGFIGTEADFANYQNELAIATLNAAKSYADTQDTETMTAAKSYADSKIIVLQKIRSENRGVAFYTNPILSSSSVKPPITQGGLCMTTSITPKKIGSKIIGEFGLNVSTNISGMRVFASAYKNSETDAITTAANISPQSSAIHTILGTFEITVTDLAAINIEVRVGTLTAATITINGIAGALVLGGALVSWINMEEIA